MRILAKPTLISSRKQAGPWYAVLACAIVLGLTWSYAQSATDLPQLLTQATKTPTVTAATAQLEAAKANLRQLQSQNGLQLSLTPGVSATNTGTSSPSVGFSTSISLSQALPLPTNPLGISLLQAEQQVRVAVWSLKEVENLQRIAVVKAFFFVILDKENLKLQQSKLELAQRTLDTLKQQLAQGATDALSMLAQQNQVAVEEASVPLAETTLQLDQINLAQAVGLSSPPATLENPSWPAPPTSVDLNAYLAHTQTTLTSVLSASEALVLAEAKQSLTQAQSFPPISLGLSASHGSMGIELSLNSQTADAKLSATYRSNEALTGATSTQPHGTVLQATLGAVIPLWDSGSSSAAAAQAQAGVAQAQEALAQAKQNAEQSVRSAYLAYEQGLSNLQAARNARILAQKQLGLIQAQQAAGLKTMLDVEQQLIQVRAADLALHQASVNAYVAYLQLRQAAGYPIQGGES